MSRRKLLAVVVKAMLHVGSYTLHEELGPAIPVALVKSPHLKVTLLACDLQKFRAFFEPSLDAEGKKCCTSCFSIGSTAACSASPNRSPQGRGGMLGPAHQKARRYGAVVLRLAVSLGHHRSQRSPIAEEILHLNAALLGEFRVTGVFMVAGSL